MTDPRRRIDAKFQAYEDRADERDPFVTFIIALIVVTNIIAAIVALHQG